MSRRTRRCVLAAFTALLTAAAGAPAVAAAPSDQQSAVSFGIPRLVDPIHTYGEPDIAVGPRVGDRTFGDVVVSGPQGTGTQRSILNVSADDGDSWRVVDNLPNPPTVPSKSTAGPGGGDTEVAIARDGKIFYDDLYDLLCFTAATSTDHGASVTPNANGCSNAPADRQWYGLFDPAPSDQTGSAYTGSKPLLYLSYNNLLTGAQVDKSTDGLTFTSAGMYGTGSGAGNHNYSEADSPIVVDQRTGDVLAAVVGDSNRIGLAVGTPDVNGDLTFTYKDLTGPLVGSPTTLFPVIAQDRNRNIYVAYVQDCGTSGTDPAITDDNCFHASYTYATAASGWTDGTSHPPVRVDAPGQASTAVFPWVAAGADGIIDVAWYGQSGTRINPSATGTTQPQVWNTYLAQVTGADTGSPTVNQSAVSPHPTHYGSICLLGSACVTAQGDRNLADFFKVNIDNDGRARVVYDDTSNGLIQPGFTAINGLFDHAGAPAVNVGTQNTGVNNLTGQPLAAKESVAPVSGVSDPTGDALVNKPLGGTNAPGGDITGVGLVRQGDVLNVTVKTAGGSVGSAAAAANAPFGQLIVRWQMGNTLYYAEVEQDAAGATTSYFAGESQSIDLCSVSACLPHFLTYPGPPNGGNNVAGTADVADGGSTYTIKVPLSAVGNPSGSSLLEQVTGLTFVDSVSATTPVSNAQAEVESNIPVQIEGTKPFNFTAAEPGTSVPEVPLAALLPLAALALLAGGYAVRRRHTVA